MKKVTQEQTSNTSIVYQEGLSISKATSWLLLLTCLIILGLGFFLSVFLFLAGFVLSMILLTLWSMSRYSSIRVNTTDLKVGKDTLLLRKIDYNFGIRNAEEILPPNIIGSLEAGISSKRQRGSLRIMGGGYSRPKNGSRWIVIKQIGSDTTLAIATRKREELMSVLQGRAT